MKLLIIVTITVYAAAATTNLTVSEKWENFKLTHNRHYLNAKEEMFRKQIFEKTLRFIEEHNEKYKRGLETFEIDVTQFADFTEEERKDTVHCFKPSGFSDNLWENITVVSEVKNKMIPTSVDWRNGGFMNQARNQSYDYVHGKLKGCGSCWAFSVVGATEVRYNIKYRPNDKRAGLLSEQQLLDCAENTNGCTNGDPIAAYKYLKGAEGLNTETDYPYEAEKKTCRYKQHTKTDVKVSNYKAMAQNAANKDALLASLVAEGPVSASIYISNSDLLKFAEYKSGIYSTDDCRKNIPLSTLNHAIVVVGYGTDKKGVNYWIIKNSWGYSWGDKGFMKMLRRKNHCGIENYVNWPVV